MSSDVGCHGGIVMDGIKYYAVKDALFCMEGIVVICDADGEENKYNLTADMKETLGKQFFNDKMNVKSISVRDSKIVLTMVKDEDIPNDQNADWVKAHIKDYGVEPSFF